MRSTLGLIVNPIAGMGGRVALKGSDDPALLALARERGAEPIAPARAMLALDALRPSAGEVELLTYGGSMGEDEARTCGLDPTVVGRPGDATTAADTRAAAAAMAERGVDLLLFAGGDGTAVDVLHAAGNRVPVLGVPSGVKMHSGVFAVNPRSAGELAFNFLRSRTRQTVEAEVMDLDEDALRAGTVSARLHGYLRVPAAPRRVQSPKARSPAGERRSQEAIAGYLVERVLGDRLCLIGPGTTTKAIMSALGLEKTLLGVDVIRGRTLVAADADERRLLELVDGDALIVVTPVGGQGFVLGRGNQQLSPRVLERVGFGNLVIIATETKIAALGGRPLLLDTGDPALDEALSGFRRVVTGYEREIVYRVAS